MNSSLVCFFLSHLAIYLSHVLLVRASGHSWGYADTKVWCSVADTCCGKSQSPIDIPKDLKPKSGSYFQFTGYKTAPKTMTVENNGHSANFISPGSSMKISGGGLKGEYAFAGLHFHWGNEKKGASEHTLGGQAFDMEMHLVHYSTAYSSVKEAVGSGKPDALAVLGVWIKEGSENKNFGSLVKTLQNIKYKGLTSNVNNPPSLDALLPKSTDKYFRYQGSLTTPECNEIVIWTVFETAVTMSKKQISAFQGLMAASKSDKEAAPLLNNFRPTQDLGSRKVTLIQAS